MKQAIHHINVQNLLAIWHKTLTDALGTPYFDQCRTTLENSLKTVEKLQTIWKTKASTSKQI